MNEIKYFYKHFTPWQGKNKVSNKQKNNQCIDLKFSELNHITIVHLRMRSCNDCR